MALLEGFGDLPGTAGAGSTPQPIHTSTPGPLRGVDGRDRTQGEGPERREYVDLTDLRVQHLTELLENERRAVRMLSHFSNLDLKDMGSMPMDLEHSHPRQDTHGEMPVLETMTGGGPVGGREVRGQDGVNRTAREVYNQTWSFGKMLTPTKVGMPREPGVPVAEAKRTADVESDLLGLGVEAKGERDQSKRGGHAPRMKPSSYDGLTSYEDYQAQFSMLAKLNEWSGETKALYLAGCLSGSARSVLNDLGAEDRYDYVKLDEALRERFGTDDQSELFKAKLRNRVKCKDETLQELAHDVRRLVRLAYPKAAIRTHDDLTKDQFIEALGDSEVRWSVFQARPKTITEALKVAMELEAFRESEKCRLRRSVRGVKVEAVGAKDVRDGVGGEEPPPRPAFDLEKVVAQIQQMAQSRRSYAGPTEAVGPVERTGMPSGASGGRTVGYADDRRTAGPRLPTDLSRIKCFRCDRMGHYVRDCPDLPKRDPVAVGPKDAPLNG
jgi:hypothetical protein